MEKDILYDRYIDILVNIIEQGKKETEKQGEIEKRERNMVSEIENKYIQISDELRSAKTAVHEQYKSVWESCTKIEGLKKPRDQRPSNTNLSWKDAIKVQEQAAYKIRSWFAEKTKRAFVERQIRIREEEARRADIALAEAEAARKKAEKDAREQKERGEALIEAMKQKHRRNL